MDLSNTRSLFISDVHLGSRHARTTELLEFLSVIKEQASPERLYIVGDFIDGWKLKRNWYWNDDASLIIRKILSFLRRDTEILYVAGNHDEFMREFIDDFHLSDFGSIHLGNEFVHETPSGKRLLVTHGDMFDLATKYARWLCWLGDVGYDFLLHANRFNNWVRRNVGCKPWSLSKAVKHNVKQAVNFISSFEQHLVHYAREKDCAGCVCGHIHTADLKVLPDGFVYANTGDWVESLTAIVEDHDGRFGLYHHLNQTIDPILPL